MPVDLGEQLAAVRAFAALPESPALAAANQLFIYRPAHYLKQFHQKYADPVKLEAEVKAEKVKGWTNLQIRKGRSFSEAGMAEITELHTRLVANLRLGMGVFLNGNVRDAQKLLEEKARFRDLERAYAATHLVRLSDNTVQSIETSSLHIDLISDLKRINSHICSIAYPILDSAGALAPSRLRQPQLDAMSK